MRIITDRNARSIDQAYIYERTGDMGGPRYVLASDDVGVMS
jgi:hypothetical protein